MMSGLHPTLLFTLCSLAELGATRGVVSATTTGLAGTLKTSQQTASRHLIALERLGLINRTRVFHGEAIRVTPKGSEELSRFHMRLVAILEPRR